MRKLLLLTFFSVSVLMYGQEEKNYFTSGQLELGLRSTTSLFGSNGSIGYGVGGQFRLRFGEWINTEWFFDYITTDLNGLGRRSDAHIGWSVLFYPFKTNAKKVNPFVIAGHCFDYTKVTPHINENILNTDNKPLARGSSAIQLGLGTHFQVHPMFDISLNAQYMLHLGKDIHSEEVEENGYKYLSVHEHSHNESGVAEGHLLITVSCNIKIADLWKTKKEKQ